MIQWLLKHGADPVAENGRDETPLMILLQFKPTADSLIEQQAVIRSYLTDALEKKPITEIEANSRHSKVVTYMTPEGKIRTKTCKKGQEEETIKSLHDKNDPLTKETIKKSAFFHSPSRYREALGAIKLLEEKCDINHEITSFASSTEQEKRRFTFDFSVTVTIKCSIELYERLKAQNGLLASTLIQFHYEAGSSHPELSITEYVTNDVSIRPLEQLTSQVHSIEAMREALHKEYQAKEWEETAPAMSFEALAAEFKADPKMSAFSGV